MNTAALTEKDGVSEGVVEMVGVLDAVAVEVDVNDVEEVKDLVGVGVGQQYLQRKGGGGGEGAEGQAITEQAREARPITLLGASDSTCTLVRECRWVVGTTCRALCRPNKTARK